MWNANHSFFHQRTVFVTVVRNIFRLRRTKNEGTLVFLQELVVLHFRRNSSRFREQRYTISSSVCPTGVVHWLRHVEVTPDNDFNSIYFKYFIYSEEKIKSVFMLGLHYVPGSHGSHGSQKRSSPWCF